MIRTGLWLRRIIDILNREWDPIGVVSHAVQDEYDGYAGKIAALIRDGTSDKQLLEYVEWAEAEHMGLGPFDTERAARVIAALRDLGVHPVATWIPFPSRLRCSAGNDNGGIAALTRHCAGGSQTAMFP